MPGGGKGGLAVLNMRDTDREFALRSAAKFMIVGMLCNGPSYGGPVAARIERVTDGRVRVSSGNLYAAIKALTAQGLIRRVPCPTGDDPKRKYYEATELGRQVFEEQLKLFQVIVEGVTFAHV